ncbi:MAG: DUF7482 domain-containing protein [Nitrososphaerales archaeon]
MKKPVIAGLAVAILITGLVIAPSINSIFNAEGSHFRDRWLGSLLKLSFANVAVDISMMKGYHDGEEVFFIATESSDKTHADLLTKKNGWKVVEAPVLSKSPVTALSKVYMFTNGGAGEGSMGQQPDVFDNTPTQTNDYSPLRKITHVTWSDAGKAKDLKSVDEIMTAQTAGDVTLQETNIVMNYPMIQWPDGQMPLRKGPVTDDMEYMGGGQVTKIDTDAMKVTFIAHRGWGPDGKSVYYIVTDATPEDPAKMMGVVYAPKTENLALSPAAVDLFQFGNGILGSGPMGFQAGIGGANPGDPNYSPMWRISFINWKNPGEARILETVDDINKVRSSDKIGIEAAMGGKHVVNCPFIELPK